MTQVKVCGLKHREDALVAAEVGAAMLGFIFAPSKRQVQPDAVRRIVSSLPHRSAVKAVGVFVNAEPPEMNRIAAYCELDYVQLSGDEPDNVIEILDVPAIQTIHVSIGDTPEALAERIAATPAALVLLDTASATAYGGTGKAFDWNLLPPLERPVLLAGGLSALNAAQAVHTVRPWGVDVSSGVETNGEKDHQKIRRFVRIVQECEV